MRNRFILLLALLAAGCDPDPDTNGGFQPYVVGGTTVDSGALPQVVGLTYGTHDMPACTGTLIRADIVLTAAHCVCTVPPAFVFVGDDPRRDASGRRKGLYYQVQAWRAAYRCGADRSHRGLDVAVLKLMYPVPDVPPIGFATEPLVDRATSFRIAGFGAIDRRGRVFRYTKEEASVDLVSSACRNTTDGIADASRYRCEAGQELVAGKPRSADTCVGDSGGPLLVAPDGTSGERSGRDFTLAGVTSCGVKGSTAACGDGGIYERLGPDVRDWIGRAIAAMA